MQAIISETFHFRKPSVTSNSKVIYYKKEIFKKIKYTETYAHRHACYSWTLMESPDHSSDDAFEKRTQKSDRTNLILQSNNRVCKILRLPVITFAAKAHMRQHQVWNESSRAQVMPEQPTTQKACFLVTGLPKIFPKYQAHAVMLAAFNSFREQWMSGNLFIHLGSN